MLFMVTLKRFAHAGCLAASAGLTCALALAAPAAHAQFTTTNLLINPGAETGNLTPWTVGGTSNPFVDNGTFNGGIQPHTGSFDFVGGHGDSGTLTQTVSLVGNQSITAAQIDAGLTTANLSFWEQGLGQGDLSDDASVTLSFRNASNVVVGTVSSGEVDSHAGAWANFADAYALPTGTRTIDYTMNFILHRGSDLDGYIDDNSLTVSSVAPAAAAPEPSTLPLALLGIVGGLGFGSRTKAARRRKPAASAS